MKKNELYIFEHDEDVLKSLRKELNIKKLKDGYESSGNYDRDDVDSVNLDEQFKNVEWSDVSIGKYAMFFYMAVNDAKSNDEGVSLSIKHVHVIVRNEKPENKDNT